MIDFPVFENSQKENKEIGKILGRLSRVTPVKAFEIRRVKHRREVNVFHILFALCMLSGLPVSPSLLNSKREKLSNWIVAWSFAATLFRTLVIVVFCAFSYLFLPSTATRFTYYGYSIFGHLLHMHFIQKRKKIVASVRKIVQITEKMDSRIISKKSELYFHLVLAFIGVVGITGMQGFFFLLQEFGDNVRKMSNYMSFSEQNVHQYNFIWFSAFTTVAAYNIGSITCYLVLLICVNAYQNIGELYSLFGKKLQKDFLDGVPTQTSICPSIVLFKQICSCLHDLDGALNACTFLIYSTAISSFFNTVSCVLSDNESYRTLVVIVYIGWTFVCGLTCFLALTFSGARVTDKNNALKDELVGLSSTIIKKSPEIKTILTFNILFENIKASRNYVTGLGLFHITKNFILTISGTMVTYGVLIYQMGAGATSE